jgi:CubicO group peptidase (beta-lactamase class C family)
MSALAANVELMAMTHSSPASVGIDPAAISAFADAADAKGLGVHGLVVARHGRVAAESWWHPYQPDDPHMMYSVSKTFTSLAVGIAIGEGLLRLDEPTHEIFPEHREIPGQTVRHLLTMTSGHAVDVFDAFRALPGLDWVRLFFEAAAPYAPGTHFVYSTAATYVLAAAVIRRSGQSLTEYLDERLFRPMGWPTPAWEKDARGIEHGGTGLKLTTRQLAELGQLLLQRGEWQGKRLVPAEWIDQASALQTRNPWFESHESRLGYGFQLWRSTHGFRADGMFGQFAVVIPELELVVATTSGCPDANQILETIWSELLPGVDASFTPAGDADGEVFVPAPRRVPVPSGAATDAATEAALAGTVFRLPSNPSGIERLSIAFDEESATFEFAGEAIGRLRVVAGRHEWVPGRFLTPVEALADAPCAARVGFAGSAVELYLQLTGTPYRWTWRLAPDAPEGPQLTAWLHPDLGLPSRTDMIVTAGPSV